MRTLQPIAQAGLRGAKLEAARLRDEAKVRRAWILTVGPTLQRQTVFLRLVQGRIVVGVWELSMIGSLRAAADSTWPHLKARLERLTKMSFTGLEMIPCDPPQIQSLESTPVGDPFEQVLTMLRRR